MTFILDALPAIGATAAASTATAGTAATASTGLSLSSILQGVATVGGLVATIAAGNAEAANAEMQARDAEANKGFEVVQSAERKRSLLKAAGEAVGEIDVAYAGSGVDLSFGSAAKARERVYREADYELDSDSATAGMRINRLTEQATNFRSLGKRMKQVAWLKGLTGAASGFASLAQQV